MYFIPVYMPCTSNLIACEKRVSSEKTASSLREPASPHAHLLVFFSCFADNRQPSCSIKRGGAATGSLLFFCELSAAHDVHGLSIFCLPSYPSQVDRHVLPPPPLPLLRHSDRHFGGSRPWAIPTVQPCRQSKRECLALTTSWFGRSH